MSALRETIEEQARGEIQRATRALLQAPLLTPGTDPDDVFVLVRRHAKELQTFFAEHVGWSLHIDREIARLRKVPPTLDDRTRSARPRPQDPPFSRRRYVLLCLALASLERTDRQTTLRRLSESIAGMVAEDEALRAAGVEFALEGRDQRRDLVAIIRWLLEHRVLVRIEGDEEAFVHERGDALYRVERHVLAQLLVAQRPPSTVAEPAFEERLTSIADELRVDSDETRRRSLRHSIVRRLLDDPVVYFDELTEEQRDYFTRSRVPITKRLEEMTGLMLELRAEGMALVDLAGDASDLALPEEGTDGHVALLVAEHLAQYARDAPGAAVEVAALRRHVAALVEVHRGHWRKEVCVPGAEVELTEQALEYLVGLRLVQRTANALVPRAGIGRFAITSVADEAP